MNPSAVVARHSLPAFDRPENFTPTLHADSFTGESAHSPAGALPAQVPWCLLHGGLPARSPTATDCYGCVDWFHY